MNLPSLDKYENSVPAGGKIFVDSTFIDRKVNRDDVDVYYIPVTKMASDAGVPTLANMILLGKVIKETDVISLEGMRTMFEKIISAKRQNLIDTNLKTIEMGYNYQ
jgi:2-oxoglutarate ferredoxin oxidoreductase subunit gamma